MEPDSNTKPASAPAPSTADGALHPANPAVSAAGGPNRGAAPSDSAATSSSTIDNRSSASLVPSAADGALRPANPAVSAAAAGPNQAARSDSAAPSSTSPSTTSSSASALVPSAADGARHPANPALSAADGTDSSSAASNAKEAWPALLDTISRARDSVAAPRHSPPHSASRSLNLGGGAAASRAAASQTNSTGWGRKGVPLATGLELLRKHRSRHIANPKKSNGARWKPANGGYERWEAAPAPYPTPSTPAKKAWGSPQLPPQLPSRVASNSTAAAATSAPTAPAQASPSSLSDPFDWTFNNYYGGVLGAAEAGAFQRYDSMFAPDGTVEELRKQAPGGLSDVLGHPPQTEPVGEWERCFSCMVNRAEVAFSPCGHMVLCSPCYERRERCPSCLMLIRCRECSGRHA